MRPEYKLKVNDLISLVESRVKVIEQMIDGSVKSNPQEAKQYILEIKNGLAKIEEMVSIS